jgi:serine/threonine protein phosphatase PrpC
MTKNATSAKLQASSPPIDFAGIEFLGDRDGQEDYFLVEASQNKKGVLAILADGMGGHASGEVASQKAVETFNKIFKEYPSDSIASKLAASLQQSNSEIANSIRSNPTLDGMGCTLVGLHVGRDGLRWISVGDSPLFIYRNGNIIQLNADHSMAPVIEESLKQGKITKEEAASHPHRNALRSAVMGSELTLIDAPVEPFGLIAGDILILASDGIMTLSLRDIESSIKGIRNKSSDEISKALIDAVKAKRRPRQDNTTAIVIKIPAAMGQSSSPSKLLRILAIVSILGFLGAFGNYLYRALDLKTLVTKVDKVPSATKEEPKPVPVPSEVKEPEPTVAQPPKEVPLASPGRSKNIGAESTSKGGKRGDSNRSEKAKPESSRDKAASTKPDAVSPSEVGFQGVLPNDKPSLPADSALQLPPKAGTPNIIDKSEPAPASPISK